MTKYAIFSLFIAFTMGLQAQKATDKPQTKAAGNPVIEGWYADPEGIIYGDQYWIFPTFSDDYGKPSPQPTPSADQLQLQANTINTQYLKQTFLDAFSSPDLVHWQKHPQVLSISNIKWAAYAMWAPSVIQVNDKYFLYFSANDIQNNDQKGGIGVAVSNKPEGPYTDALGKPLINCFYNGAQPIDQFVFRDTDGSVYMYYGGWGHCNVVRLNADMISVGKHNDGQTYREITPDNYVEGPFVFKRNNFYYLMWSEGGWTGPDYSVAYAMSKSPTGPFKRIGKILQQDPAIATGAGHHSVIHVPDTDTYYIVYHRRPIATTNGNHREVCIENMYFDENNRIIPVKLTFEGVKSNVIK
jgi:beta-xylosidase